MVTPHRNVSPFDVNMALDAGYDAVVPYAGVTLEEVKGLIEDAIFSRPPKAGARTGVFFGGRSVPLALDMLARAKAAMVPPFKVSLFADPAGSFTTAAAMVACMEKTLRVRFARPLAGTRLAVFGATGPLGFSLAAIAAREGAAVTAVGYDGIRRVSEAAAEIKARFALDVAAADGSDEDKKEAILAASEVVAACGRAGVRILSAAAIEQAAGLLLAADANAVPPAGIEGIDAAANGVALNAGSALGIGPLAAGDIKYRTQSGLFGQMIAAAAPLEISLHEAFVLARSLNG